MKVETDTTVSVAVNGAVIDEQAARFAALPRRPLNRRLLEGLRRPSCEGRASSPDCEENQ